MANLSLSPARKRFLTANARRFALLQQAPTLVAAAKAAATASKRATGASGRGGSLAFERELVRSLLDPVVAAAIETEYLTLARTAADDDVLGIDFRKGVGIADLFVVWKLNDDSDVIVAVNVKRCALTTNNTELCAVGPFMALATEPTFEVSKPTASRDLPTWRMAVEWVARRRKILQGRDYYLLVGTTDSDHKLTEIRFEGALAQMSRSKNVTAVKLHSNRDVLVINLRGVPLADDYDINAGLSRRLLPPADLDALRALVLAVLTSDKDDAQAAHVAALLLDLSDEELIGRLSALAPQ